MSVTDILNQYIAELGCSAKELANASGLSEASVSRYRTGERSPNHDQMNQLIKGLIRIAAEKGSTDIDESAVRVSFETQFSDTHFDYDLFVRNFNALISALDVKISGLSKALNFDPSYLSRIRTGQRRPSDWQKFAAEASQYVIRTADRSSIAGLIGCPVNEISSDADCNSRLYEWLSNGKTKPDNHIDRFLKELNDFDLDEFIRSVHFNELKVPTVPFQLPVSKSYYGIDAMKQGELDFFKATVLSKSKEPVFMCGDMPMDDMGADKDFGKKWMYAIAMTLKKGLHINIIHDIDRPFQEMMLGLEAWIPIYMTGQISPYYIRGKQHGVYCHLDYVSGQAALTGECIQNFHADGHYYLTKNKQEVSYYQKKAAHLLSKAHPLMDIYRVETKNAFAVFEDTNMTADAERHNILSTLPIYTISEALLKNILKRNSVCEADREEILAYRATQQQIVETVLNSNRITDDVSIFTREEFEQYPACLSLSGVFYEKELRYSYEEYLQHLEEIKQFARTHENYCVNLLSTHAFRNIQIQILKGKLVMISKNNAPAIHFVIHHKKMLQAFENFICPLVE